jgi:hypothetical protein
VYVSHAVRTARTCPLSLSAEEERRMLETCWSEASMAVEAIGINRYRYRSTIQRRPKSVAPVRWETCDRHDFRL